MPEPAALKPSADDPHRSIWVKIRQSRWDRIQEIARVEQRDPRAMAGILLERAADSATVAA